MDVNNIFKPFENNTLKVENADVKNINIKEHPLYFLMMFKKILNTKELFYLEYLKIQKKHPEIDSDLITEYVNGKIFDKAYNYIKNIKTNDLKHQESLFLSNNKTSIIPEIEYVLSYFEKKEEFEKCVVLNDIKNFIKLFST